SSDTSGPDGGAASCGGARVVLDGGGPLPTPPDGPAACPKGACNYQTNEGCAAGESCFTNFSGQTVTPTCVPAGSKTRGASCTDQTECAAGYLCVAGSCQKLCCGGDWTGCPSANEHCFFEVKYGDGNGGAIDTGAMVCYPVNTCDALTPSSCTTPGQTCQ